MKSVLRIIVLVGLLLASGPLQWRYGLERMRINQEGMISALPLWLALMGIAAVFVVVAIAGREQRTHAALLSLEGVIAAVLSLVPQLVWAQLVGPGLFLDAMGGTTGMAFAPVLTVVWLVIVVRAGLAQRRRG